MQVLRFKRSSLNKAVGINDTNYQRNYLCVLTAFAELGSNPSSLDFKLTFQNSRQVCLHVKQTIQHLPCLERYCNTDNK